MEDEIFYVIITDKKKYIDSYFVFGEYPKGSIIECYDENDIHQAEKFYNFSECCKFFNLLKRWENKKLNNDQLKNSEDENVNIEYKGKVKNIVKITLQKEIVQFEG